MNMADLLNSDSKPASSTSSAASTTNTTSHPLTSSETEASSVFDSSSSTMTSSSSSPSEVIGDHHSFHHSQHQKQQLQQHADYQKDIEKFTDHLGHAIIKNKSNGDANEMTENSQHETNKTVEVHDSTVAQNGTHENSNGKAEESPEDDENLRVSSSNVSDGNISDGKNGVEKPTRKAKKPKKKSVLDDLLEDADWFTNDFGSRRGLRKS
ncbi:unnamed protein product [Ambrosiozyma monospora]|uniref:Unnamed protein product n=1 Tax=Ambrosiozyma monospora TaxID=43982 RepID=A0ACB5T2J3_AMBMO|nr:unnamed protein product [Ambrosiozyma monospora]